MKRQLSALSRGFVAARATARTDGDIRSPRETTGDGTTTGPRARDVPHAARKFGRAVEPVLQRQDRRLGARKRIGPALRRRGDRGPRRRAAVAPRIRLAGKSTARALALLVGLAACGDRSGSTASATVAPIAVESVTPSSAPSTHADAPAGPSGVASSASPSDSGSAAAPPKCAAPSLTLSNAIDAFDDASIATCQKLARGTKKCGVKPGAIDMARFEASALAIDAETEERIVRVATLGKAKGMDPRSFALVGDSITVFRDFMRPFTADGGSSVKIAPEVERALALDPIACPAGAPRSIIEWYRGHTVQTYAGRPLDAFAAERVAKVGARASYPMIGGEASPLAQLVEHIHPAIAIVTFGANDAAYRTAPIEELASEFEGHMMEMIAALEERGVVVLLENEMRHGDQPGVKACPSDDANSNDWRTAVSTNRIVRRTAEIACREHLPFVDFRWALEGATAFGLGPDAVHPSIKGKGGGGHLDEAGLDCGFNIRSLVTLLGLRNVVNTLVRRGVFTPLE